MENEESDFEGIDFDDDDNDRDRDFDVTKEKPYVNFTAIIFQN